MRLYAAGSTFLLTLLLGRILGPEGFGAYTFALGWVAIATFFTTLGFHHFTIRAIPPLIANNRMSEVFGLFVCASLLILTLSGLVTILARLNPALFSQNLSFQAAVGVASLLLLPRSWSLLRTGVLQGLGRPVVAQLPERLIEPTLLLVGVIACLIIGEGLEAEDALYLTLGAVLVSVALGAPSLVRTLDRIRARPTFDGLRAWMVGATKSSLVFAAGTLLAATDVIMLGFLSTPEETGIYGVAVRFFFLMGLPFHASAVFISQRAALLNARKDFLGLQALAEKAAIRTIWSSLLLAIPSTIAAYFVGDIFGKGFISAGSVILLLVWTRFGLSFFGEPTAFLANTQHVGRVSVIMIAAAFLNVIFNALLAGPFGAIGAATATVITYILMTMVLSNNLYKVVGVRAFYGVGFARALKRNEN